MQTTSPPDPEIKEGQVRRWKTTEAEDSTGIRDHGQNRAGHGELGGMGGGSAAPGPSKRRAACASLGQGPDDSTGSQA